MSDPDWPFDQPPRWAVIILRSIVFSGKPILYVSHEEEDHGWQILNCEEEFDLEDAAVVALEEIVKRDPTVLEVADLPPGWCAERSFPGAKWQRAPKNSD